MARNNHTCNENVEATQAPAITDVRAEMRTALQEASISNLSLLSSLIWERVMASFREAYPTATLNTIPRLPSISIVNYSMTPATGGDAFRAIESVPTGNVVEDDRRHFLQVNVAKWTAQISGVWISGPSLPSPLLELRSPHRRRI
ncbi:hypothetical protein PF005_g22227 [Phytophthora fragariae]|uniref:Uncharacterized protein n=1 Tax=Phytophthora fragariae TaxID=53985 RepID=A0A6A3ICT5_9STRA|nr:hypothetical protein PF003_g37070 [Phytophthora fragariae]KAE8926945.1 hypothetical protein PF009_g22880 [Phytophthora fragariae]KAE8977874.1 hypothetical protein PF011_g23474 [Phytophthora fragariae]KAE9076723.1 hypothetical protein PF010_g23790 [Phytophthora fragariae]KAE9082999.1 hypothetical protein PF007_g22085 [Phytophthora fragariae]